MTYLLTETIANGTGRKAKIDRPIAGKTGTSQSLRDAWFVGFSSYMVAGVWFGNDNDSPMKKITGGNAPAILWREFMLKAHKNKPVKKLVANTLVIKKNSRTFQDLKKKKEDNLFEKLIENMF